MSFTTAYLFIPGTIPIPYSCTDVIKLMTEANHILSQFVHTIRTNTREMQDLRAKNPLFKKIVQVPSLLVLYSDGRLQIYEGQKVVAWLLSFLNTMAKKQEEQRVEEPAPLTLENSTGKKIMFQPIATGPQRQAEEIKHPSAESIAKALKPGRHFREEPMQPAVMYPSTEEQTGGDEGTTFIPETAPQGPQPTVAATEGGGPKRKLKKKSTIVFED